MSNPENMMIRHGVSSSSLKENSDLNKCTGAETSAQFIHTYHNSYFALFAEKLDTNQKTAETHVVQNAVKITTPKIADRTTKILTESAPTAVANTTLAMVDASTSKLRKKYLGCKR